MTNIKKVNSRDEKYMRRCLDLALQGLGNTGSNPLVGSVIVHNDKIIGEGYHKKYGDTHAEVNAILSVKNKDLLKESILYVNLEPCSHHGKTPPCADFLIENKIPKVVIGNVDPSLKVSGKGIEKLKKSGCEVISGVLEDEGVELNKRFFTFHQEKRPYVILKWAQTKDGFIDVIRKKNAPKQPTWITSEVGRSLVHKWRVEEQAIMVGTNTAKNDNPKLTVRDWRGEHPLRIVIDQSLRLDKQLNIFDGETPTILFTSISKEKSFKVVSAKYPVEVVGIDFSLNMVQQIFDVLYEKEVQSLIVEGGEQILNYFIKMKVWDEARVFVGEMNFHKGVNAPIIYEKIFHSEQLKNSRLNIYKNS